MRNLTDASDSAAFGSASMGSPHIPPRLSADDPEGTEIRDLVARDTHKGDPKKQLRELRLVLGWDIVSHRTKENGVTAVTDERQRLI